MFARRLRIECIDTEGIAHLCPIRWLDSFSMRNFTNDAIFDDTLPVEDGVLEAGFRVPIDRLHTSMTDWFRRKSYIGPGEQLRISEPDIIHPML